MRYAKVVFGLPIEGPFDYLVPERFRRAIKPGSRVWAPLRTSRKVGYVVGLASSTGIANPRPIDELIDEAPLLSSSMLALTREVSRYYCASWGEAIEAALPEGIRRGKKVAPYPAADLNRGKVGYPKGLLFHDPESLHRLDFYLREIQKARENKKHAIVLFPDAEALARAQKFFEGAFGRELAVLHRKGQARDLAEWERIRRGEAGVCIGTRAAVFAPFQQTGVIIIDEEQDSVYKQEQAPHYHAREVAAIRCRLEKARLVLASRSPSLESMYLAKKGELEYASAPRARAYPAVKLLQGERKAVFSEYLKSAISEALQAKGKVLVFLNRKGFATSASCNSCGTALKCERCGTNLVFHFKENLLSCCHCNFKMPPPQLCPACNAGYIRYQGLGTEKAESELSRIFPQARIRGWREASRTGMEDTDIAVATEAAIRGVPYEFDVVAAISVDNLLNRIDFRASEKTFALLSGLACLTAKKMIVQTALASHYVFKALCANQTEAFYEQELAARKQLGFPPFRHLAAVRLRGRRESKVKAAAASLFERLKERNKTPGLKVVSLSQGQPPRLRGNFYWQILLSSARPSALSRFLRIQLDNFRVSGIIITVDIDPL